MTDIKIMIAWIPKLLTPEIRKWKKIPDYCHQYGIKNSCYLFLECFFISGVKFFTFINRKMRTFDLLIVKGDTLLIVKCVSYN